MQLEVHEGFSVYKNGYGPVFVALHSGPTTDILSGRDSYSDMIASFCFERNGGTLILANITRNRVYGIDFNREIPDLDVALDMYSKFLKNSSTDLCHQYKRKYSFVAENKKDYQEKVRIYKKFWSYIRTSGDFIIFIHTLISRLKNFSSIIDLITFNSRGIDKHILNKIIGEVNEANAKFFKRIESDYKQVILLEQKRIVNSISIDKINLEKDMKIADQWCYKKIDSKSSLVLQKNKDYLDFLQNRKINLNDRNTKRILLKIFKYVLKNAPTPKITLENIYNAETAIGPIKEIVKNGRKIAIEVEINSFISRWYPEETVKIIIDIINKIKQVDEYKKLGFSQTQILKFFA